jgi:uncharacterized OB-fold protein
VFPAVFPYTISDAVTEPFWAAARDERLVAQRCVKCGTFRLPPAPICFRCRSKEADWVELAGTGTVYASTIVRHPLHPGLAEVVPYVSAIIELDGTQGEGARLLANVIECDPEEIRIGTPVEIVWDHVNDELTVYRFRPVRDGAGHLSV